MHPDRTTLHGELIRVPLELHRAMEDPRKVRFYSDEAGHWFVYRATALTIARAYAGFVLARLRGRAERPWFARPVEREGQFVVYRAARSLPDADAPTSYTITNYHPLYCLMRADDQPEDASREAAWASMEGYHEHLNADEQEETSNELSAWLVRDVLSSFGASSFLEVGCGGGRNLLWLDRELPEAELHGVEINPRAVEMARAQAPTADVVERSLYELDGFGDGSIDVVYTSGVLEHVPHDRVDDVIREMHRIARIAVVHFELHGPSHRFDYHRYPRDYRALYRGLFPGADFGFEVFPRSDFRARSFEYSLLTARTRAGSPAVGDGC